MSDEVAEWLRRWTANPLGSPRVGSNPILVDFCLDSFSSKWPQSAWGKTKSIFQEVVSHIQPSKRLSWLGMSETYQFPAVTRIRTWVVSATTRSTNHYTITATLPAWHTVLKTLRFFLCSTNMFGNLFHIPQSEGLITSVWVTCTSLVIFLHLFHQPHFMKNVKSNVCNEIWNLHCP